jgi:glycosyltransferase involved in cell wall biosynthesis
MLNFSERVSIFMPSLGAGGAERSMIKLAGGIAARGYPVDLVLARAEGPFLAEVPKEVRLVNLKASRVLTSLPALVQYLRREQPAALLSVLHANLIALWARRMAHVHTRLVISERNTLSIEIEHYSSDIRFRLGPKLARLFYPWADSIVAVSKGVADDLARLIKVENTRIQVIYNPIVTPELMEKAHAPLEHPWFKAGQPSVILSVGRLTQQKDYPTLIRAFRRARQSHPAHLLILGEGEERPALESLIWQLALEKDVSLPGFIPNPYPYMVRACLFVLSSKWEGLPGVLIEALCCGVPLIATDCPSGPREILANGRYGQLVPLGDMNALALAIGNGLRGKIPRPPQESRLRFELNEVVNQYLKALLGF